MSPYFSWIFQFRLLFTIAATILLVALLSPRFRASIVTALVKDPNRPMRVNGWLLVASATYFSIALVSKYSQLEARVLNGIDFWLIEDMLRHMATGQAFITRYTLQVAGPIQHGGMHAYLSMWILIPFVKVLGSTMVAILLIPVSFTLTGYLIGDRLSRVTDSPLVIIGTPVAFWMSEWTNRVLLYDTHPEAMYAPLVFLTVLATERLSRNRRLIDWCVFLLTWAALSVMKQDALVYGFVLSGFLFTSKRMKALPTVVSLATVFGAFMLMTQMIALYKAGALGPAELKLDGFNVPVTLVREGSAGLNGRVIGTIGDFFGLFDVFMPDGLFAFVKRGIAYMFFSPFTMITLIAPWLWLRRSFWLTVVPIAVLLGGMNNGIARLHTYNSIIFVCFIWLSLTLELERLLTMKARDATMIAVVWALCFCAVHGGSSPMFYIPNSFSENVKAETKSTVSRLSGLGIVSSRLLKDVDAAKVWSDIAPVAPNANSNRAHAPVRNPDLAELVVDEFSRASFSPENASNLPIPATDLAKLSSDISTSMGENQFANPPAFVKWILFPKNDQSFEFEYTQFSQWQKLALNRGWRLVPGKYVDLLVRD